MYIIFTYYNNITRYLPKISPSVNIFERRRIPFSRIDDDDDNNNNNNNNLTAPVETSTWQERPGLYPTDCRRVPWKTHTRFNTRYIRTVFYNNTYYYIILYYYYTNGRGKMRKIAEILYSNIPRLVKSDFIVIILRRPR